MSFQLFFLDTIKAQKFVQFEKSNLNIVTETGKYNFSIEIAVSEQQKVQGLMYRPSLNANSGMLFDYQVPTRISMWMKNTLIPLDMIFISSSGIVKSIVQRTIPMSEVRIVSEEKVRAVLEVNGGTTARLNIKVGDRVSHPIFGN